MQATHVLLSFAESAIKRQRTTFTTKLAGFGLKEASQIGGICFTDRDRLTILPNNGIMPQATLAIKINSITEFVEIPATLRGALKAKSSLTSNAVLDLTKEETAGGNQSSFGSQEEKSSCNQIGVDYDTD